MRTIIITLILASSMIIPSAHAGVLSRGNVFAEGLTGCSLGITVGIIGTFLVASQAPLAGATAANNLGWMGYCLIGGTVAAIVHGVVEFSGMDKEFFHLHGAMEEKTLMVYPATPGREY